MASGYGAPSSGAATTGGTDNGQPKQSTGWASITMMSDTILPKSISVMHIPFPVSKQAVRSFRGELEDNIEFVSKPNGSSRLRDLLIPGSSKFNASAPFSTPRGFEEPFIMRDGKQLPRSALHMEDLMSSPTNAEANPAPSAMPI